jgi:hypothetical protein
MSELNSVAWMRKVRDAIAEYGYVRQDGGVRCLSCEQLFRPADGSIMRGHAKRCPVNPRVFEVPGVCNA